MKPKIILAIVFIFLCSSSLNAEIYSYIDKNGIKHYSNVSFHKVADTVKVLDEINYDRVPDEVRRIKDEKFWHTQIQEQKSEKQTANKAVALKSKAQIDTEANITPSREKLIQIEREKLEKKIFELEALPTSVYGNSRSKQKSIGRYRYKLEALTASPEKYFGW
jgi:hypothetical protein